MKKTIFNCFVFLIASITIKAIDFSGEFYVKAAPVISQNKIVIYKHGSDAEGKNGLVFNYNIQKNTNFNGINLLPEQRFWVKKIPTGPGLTEQEVRKGTYIVPKEKIRVGLGSINDSGVIDYAVAIEPHISFSSVRIGIYEQLGTLGIKAHYDQNLKVYLFGKTGIKAGSTQLNGKFTIKVMS